MAHLFSPITIARTKLPNRIVLSPLPGGYAALDGFVDDALIEYYARFARGGVGLILTEPVRVVPPVPEETRAHIGLYADVFVPQLRRMVQVVHEHPTRIFALLDAPATYARSEPPALRTLAEHFILAAWRAMAAGFDGIMLSAADGGALHALVSPLHNRRYDAYGKTLDGRLLLPLVIIESIRRWLRLRLAIGFRLVADELTAGGMTLQDARMVASRVVGAGVHLLDVVADLENQSHVARFPGWCVPLANGIKRVLPDVPVIGSGLLGEPYLADSVVRDGSIDLVMIGHTLLHNPEWPRLARSFLLPEGG
jgi:2,4-dienoyl-CoA reductase-like NADH-dependent reductase (Old Yellow Enzyme family)